MLIGELATAAGLSREALRFYEQQGLIRSRRLSNGYRDYPEEVLMLVNYIRTAQQLGFTLAEIGHRLPAIWDASEPGPAIAQVLGEKLLEIDARIGALQGLRAQLAQRLNLDCPLTATP
jgi:MerR family copper efflux transcriptional regulator